MKYFVTGETIETGQFVPPEQLAQILEQGIIPTLEACAKMETENKILAGGMFAGARTGVAIIEAESNEEVSSLLQTFPSWGQIKWTITPLESFAQRIKQNQDDINRLKAPRS